MSDGLIADKRMEEATVLYRPVGQEELEEFNRNIVGEIEVVAEYHRQVDD
jgi:hypothetical protein